MFVGDLDRVCRRDHEIHIRMHEWPRRLGRIRSSPASSPDPNRTAPHAKQKRGRPSEEKRLQEPEAKPVCREARPEETAQEGRGAYPFGVIATTIRGFALRNLLCCGGLCSIGLIEPNK
jgi:hypothetical protein